MKCPASGGKESRGTRYQLEASGEATGDVSTEKVTPFVRVRTFSDCLDA